MLFPTLAFHVYFLIVFALNWLLARAREWRQIMLLLASWLFYAVWDGRFVALLMGSALLNWGCARAMLAWPRGQRALLTLGVLANLGTLAFFKYFDFFRSGLNALLAQAGLHAAIPAIDIVLPVGISFFTFQGISYIVDVARRDSPPAGLLELAVLMSFFPHLVAGPIVRPAHILPQLRADPVLSRGAAATSLVLIVWGLFKKAVIANELAVRFVDPVFNAPGDHGAIDLVLAAYGYAAQIYCDFSAYTDMAIGFAGLLGLRFPVNFNQPYRAASLQDFWRRWHITLSSWLRDYLYIGLLGGSRQAAWRTYLALFTTMVLGGLWHGASINFLIWGALHGGMLAIERVWRAVRPDHWPRLPDWACRVLTFHFVTLAWIFFRCHAFGDALGFVRRIVAGMPGPVTLSPWCAGLIVVGMACHYGPADAVQRIGARLRRWPGWTAGLAVAAALVVIEGLRGAGVAPFIYFQF